MSAGERTERPASPVADRGPRVSAGIVVLRPGEGGEWRCLLLRAFRNWDFPKGLVEAGESAVQAAIRETREETGLDGLAFRWGEGYYQTEPYAGGKIARFYLAEWTGGDVTLPVNPDLGRPEHHEFRWVPLESAALMLAPRLQHVITWATHRLETQVDGPEAPAQHPDNELVVRVLREIAGLLVRQGANPYRIAAYRQAATVVAELGSSVRALFDHEGVAGLDRLPHVGRELAALIAEVLITGGSEQLERLRAAQEE
jgi:8-oxo-dGTP pyrophosphatase MutT (NUDIX family)